LVSSQFVKLFSNAGWYAKYEMLIIKSNQTMFFILNRLGSEEIVCTGFWRYLSFFFSLFFLFLLFFIFKYHLLPGIRKYPKANGLEVFQGLLKAHFDPDAPSSPSA